MIKRNKKNISINFILLFVLLFPINSFAASPYVEIIYPTENTTLKPGDFITLNWKAYGFGSLGTGLSIFGENGSFSIASFPNPSDGTRSYNWVVPSYIPKGDYLLSASSLDKGPSIENSVSIRIENKTGKSQTIDSVKATPDYLKSGAGKVTLAVRGTKVENYSLNVSCLKGMSVKSGSKELCNTWTKFSTKKLKNLRLKVKNPEKISGPLGFTIDVADPIIYGSIIRKFVFVDLITDNQN